MGIYRSSRSFFSCLERSTGNLQTNNWAVTWLRCSRCKELHHPDFCKPRADAHKPQVFNFCLEHPLCADMLPLSHVGPNTGRHLQAPCTWASKSTGISWAWAGRELKLRYNSEHTNGLSFLRALRCLVGEVSFSSILPVLVVQLLNWYFTPRSLSKVRGEM